MNCLKMPNDTFGCEKLPIECCLPVENEQLGISLVVLLGSKRTPSIERNADIFTDFFTPSRLMEIFRRMLRKQHTVCVCLLLGSVPGNPGCGNRTGEWATGD